MPIWLQFESEGSSTIRIALRSVRTTSTRILKRTHMDIEAMCTDFNVLHEDQNCFEIRAD